MLIAHINSERGCSGGEVQVFLLIDALAKLGFENLLVSPSGSWSEKEAKARSIPTFGIRMRNDFDVRSLQKLTHSFRIANPDVVHLHTGRATWLGGLAAKFAGKPALTTRRMDRRVSRGPRTKLIYGTLVQRAVAISPAVRDCLIEGGVAEDSIDLIWDAVDPDGFAPDHSRDEVRAELGISAAEIVLITTAALVRRKGIDVLIEAVAQVCAAGTPIRLLIAGVGEERELLESLSSERGVAAQVQFLGWRSDKEDLLAASDIFVLASRREGLGVAALEAMAAGVPVVASRVGGLSQAVVEGETGFLVEPENSNGMADAIVRLAKDANLRREIGQRGRERVAQKFGITEQAKQYVESYKRVIEAKGAGTISASAV